MQAGLPSRLCCAAHQAAGETAFYTNVQDHTTRSHMPLNQYEAFAIGAHHQMPRFHFAIPLR